MTKARKDKSLQINKDYVISGKLFYIKINKDIYQLIKTPYKELPIFNMEV